MRQRQIVSMEGFRERNYSCCANLICLNQGVHPKAVRHTRIYSYRYATCRPMSIDKSKRNDRHAMVQCRRRQIYINDHLMKTSLSSAPGPLRNQMRARIMRVQFPGRNCPALHHLPCSLADVILDPSLTLAA
jgi:hypothetical protein